MKSSVRILFILANAISLSSSSQTVQVIRNITLIDGTGNNPKENVSLVLRNDLISAVLPSNASLPKDATVIDYSGKFVIPAMINGHCHLGLLKGDDASPRNYSSENILSQLQKYERYGVGRVLCLGTDQQIIFPMRDSSQRGLLPGATIYTAGYGLATNNAPPTNLSHSILQPQTVGEAIKDVDRLATFRPDFIKIWVDDFNGTVKKMQPEIYEAIIQEAHKKGLRVAAHLYYLEDAKKLVKAGVDAIAHSIRDKDVDDELINALKQKGVYYIPTLTLDDYNVVYADDPDWINDPFFKASLEQGVWERLTSEKFKQQLHNDSTLSKKMAAFETALRNLKKIADANVTIVLGTDSGAQPVRTQGFSEHLELQLMVEAGMTPMQAIIAASNSGARMLHIDEHCGTLKKGMKADFIVLNGNPLTDIKQTRTIESVWKDGKKVAGAINN